MGEGAALALAYITRVELKPRRRNATQTDIWLSLRSARALLTANGFGLVNYG